MIACIGKQSVPTTGTHRTSCLRRAHRGAQRQLISPQIFAKTQFIHECQLHSAQKFEITLKFQQLWEFLELLIERFANDSWHRSGGNPTAHRIR
jgi:hypothetical protein